MSASIFHFQIVLKASCGTIKMIVNNWLILVTVGHQVHYSSKMSKNVSHTQLQELCQQICFMAFRANLLIYCVLINRQQRNMR